jgi:hypothetical protein
MNTYCTTHQSNVSDVVLSIEMAPYEEIPDGLTLWVELCQSRLISNSLGFAKMKSDEI